MAENVEPLNRFNDLGISRMQFFRCQSRNCGISKLSEGWVYEQRRVGGTPGGRPPVNARRSGEARDSKSLPRNQKSPFQVK